MKNKLFKGAIHLLNLCFNNNGSKIITILMCTPVLIWRQAHGLGIPGLICKVQIPNFEVYVVDARIYINLCMQRITIAKEERGGEGNV